MTALDAFSIDAMLPALHLIGGEFAIAADNHRQYVITSLFLGFSLGVLVYGFIADQFGRRKPALAGFVLFIAGSLVCITSTSFEGLLVGRVLQGLGAAGPYVLSVAIIRDQYEGRAMARIMSLITMVFIGIPMIAPFVGQGILLVAGWRSIFSALMVFAMTIMFWFWIRQAETLKPEYRQAISGSSILHSLVEVFTNRQSLRYLLAIGAVAGALITYLMTSQQVFQDIYSLGVRFPLTIASLASLFGLASYFNARWVVSIGSARLVHYALTAIVIVSLIFMLIYGGSNPSPPLWSYIVYMAVIMFAFAFLFGNMTALALEPLGHIAGSASSLVSSVSTGIAILFATFIGGALNENVLPIVAGFGVLCLFAWCLNYPQLRIHRKAA